MSKQEKLKFQTLKTNNKFEGKVDYYTKRRTLHSSGP